MAGKVRRDVEPEPLSRRVSLRGSTRSSVAVTPEPLPTRINRRSSRTFVPNTSDMEDPSDAEQDIIKVGKPAKIGRLHAVVVPSKRSKEIVHDSDDSASSLSSLTGSSNMDNSMDYETPATSKSMTPNGALQSTSKKKSDQITGSKRKRSTRLSTVTTSEGVNTAGDEELAQRLQREEYGGVQQSSDVNVPLNVVDDSDDVAAESLGNETSSSDDEPLASSSKRPRVMKKRPRKAATAASSKPSKLGINPVAHAHSNASDSESSALSSLHQFDEDDESDFEEDVSDIDVGRSRATSEATLTSLSSGQAASSTAHTRNDARLARARLARSRAASRARRLWRRGMDRKQRRRLKLETAHPEIKTMWDELRAVPVITPTPAAQPTSITRKLKSFQLEGLDWMVKQEKSHYRGGLLGDEMGMGKTIQAVSLIMSDYPAKQPTLVVVPPVALMQWQNEIREYTDGKLNVLVIHNSNTKSKDLTVKDIKKYNVLLISYNSLESMYRKETKGWSRGENIIKEKSPIHAVQFHRLILDEAHSIKQRTTGVAKACFALKGDYKWCLSGTPVQNRIGEFFSLLRFLEVRPFADYFCEKCDCAQLHWSLNEEYMCDHCNHSGAEHRSVFNEELLNPITGDDLELRSEALDKLHLITARVMLRRMKRDHTSSMELPPKEIVIHNEFFGEIERDFSKSIMTNSSRKFDTYVAQGVMLNNYANIFGLIMQMRQVANHPDLLLKKHAEGGQNVLVCNICDEPAEEAIRSRCRHEFCRACVKSYVQSCEGAGTEPDCPRCHIPLSIDWDQPDIEQDEELVKKSSIINRIKMGDWTSSTKIEMLVYDLYKLRSKKQTLKSIVFSQFTSMLQLIEWRLRRAGFNTVMLDGSMTPVQRQRSIDYFMKNTDVEVFLVSLKAGGVALNLTEASRVFIVDPWWNPAAEWQSADRCHRIGQKRPCVITRLCIEDSVESRMVMLQEKKASMISASINNDKVAMEKLSPEDLQFLFRGT